MASSAELSIRGGLSGLYASTLLAVRWCVPCTRSREMMRWRASHLGTSSSTTGKQAYFEILVGWLVTWRPEQTAVLSRPATRLKKLLKLATTATDNVCQGLTHVARHA